MNKSVIYNIQTLRAVAAIGVVFYHLQAIVNDAFATELHSLYGAYGVDIFFVISGFIMFYNNQQFKYSPKYFMINRLWRIVPLYWMATFTITLFYVIGFHPNGLMHLDVNMLVTSLFFIPSAFPENRHDLVLNLGWTLMYEIFFYFSFAATFRFRLLERSFLIISVGFLILIASRYFVSSQAYLVEFFRRPILVEFLYGAALAVVFVRLQNHPAMRSMSLGFLLLVAGFLVPIPVTMIYGETSVAIDGLRCVLLGVPALAVVAGALIFENAGMRVRSQALLLVGSASYALYLFHPVLIQGSVKIVSVVLKEPGALNATVAIFTAMGVALIGGIFVHLVLERPILGLIHRITAQRGNVASSL